MTLLHYLCIIIITSPDKTGHIARMCRAKQKSRHNSLAHVSDGDKPDNDLTLQGVYSGHAYINYVSGCKGISVKAIVGCEIVPMQLDIAAAVSIISEGTHRSVLSTYPIQASNITLKTYRGDAIPIAGKLYITVTYGKQRFMLPLVVACGERPALLGRELTDLGHLVYCTGWTTVNGRARQ